MRKLLLAIILALVLSFVPSPAQAEPTCTVTVLGASPNLTVQCVDDNGNPIPPADIDVQKVVGNTVTLVVHEVQTVTKTITKTVPGPVKTIFVPRPRATRTVYVPGDTRTVTVTIPQPGPTRYVAGPVVTKTPQAITETATTTATVTETPKTVVKRVSVSPKPENGTIVTLPPFHLSAPEAVGYSVLGLLAVCGLILLGLWLGYILGWKDKERRELKFLDALRDQFYTRGKHS